MNAFFELMVSTMRNHAVVRTCRVFVDAKEKDRDGVLGVIREHVMPGIPDDRVGVAQTDPLIVLADCRPLALQAGVQLDDVAGLGGGQRTAGVEMVAKHTIRGAAHDVVIKDLPNAGLGGWVRQRSAHGYVLMIFSPGWCSNIHAEIPTHHGSRDRLE